MQGPAATNRVNDVPWWQHGKTGLDYVDYYTEIRSNERNTQDKVAFATVIALIALKVAEATLSPKP